MKFQNVFIPYGAYWSTPFCKWQGSLAAEHPLRLAARVARQKFDASDLDPAELAGLHLGTSVPSHHSFFGAPWVAAMLGAPHVTGPTIAQACATSARLLASAGAAIALGGGAPQLVLAADRISNGPHVYYPAPDGPGGTGRAENWVMDNFNCDPWADVAMVDTAENIARRFGFDRGVQEALTLHRYGQYALALDEDRSFQRRYMVPVEVGRGRKTRTIEADEGVAVTNPEAMARLVPVREGGSVTYATQTHPADGHCGIVLCGAQERDAISAKPEISVELLSFGEGKAEKAHMGMAVVPAARAALAQAEIGIDDLSAIKTHNPFVVNDLYFAQETGFDAWKMNNFGSSLVFGHPQAPTGLRLIVELIEELALKGGGYGMMAGCAAGDSAAAVVIRVT